MSDIKLLRCPFCDGEAKLCDASSGTNGRYRVRCKEISCTLRPKTEWYETKDEAIRHWNHRRPIERILKRLEQIEQLDSVAHVEGSNEEILTNGYVKGIKKAINVVKIEGGAVVWF